MQKYRDSSLPVEERVEDLLSVMTLKEKIGQLNQKIFGWNAYKKLGDKYEISDAFKEEVAFGDGVGALYGIFRADPWSQITFENGIPVRDCAKVTNMLQRYVIENTRLGIPMLFSEECPHGHMALDGTMFPTNTGIGSTWNPELYEEAFSCVAAEIRARGGNVGLVSALDILRDPRWGRSEECYGEDPYLASRMAEAATRGLQGNSPDDLAREDKVAAVLKHFCAQGASVGGHNGKTAIIGERELREIHFPALQAGIKAGAAGCMAAYNEIDGVYCHANKWLFTDILREEWGFEGVVMSDGCAVDNLTKITGTDEGAAAMAVAAGVDMNLWNRSFMSLEKAVLDGILSEDEIDKAVRRVLALKFKLGLFEKPYTDESISEQTVGNEAAKGINLRTAQESVVLLKNDEKILPLKKDIKRIAVIGPNADNIYSMLGDYTPPQRVEKSVTVLGGIRSAAGEKAEIVYAKGCGIRDTSRAGFDEAIKAAESSDVAVLVLGGSSARNFDIQFDINGAAIVTENQYEMDCGEGMDVAELYLGGVQEELVKEISKTGTPIVAVLIQGRPHAISRIVDSCKAILCGWYPGSEGGRAIGDILFGNVNPSGKLSVSIPIASAQLPVYYNNIELSHYMDMTSEPLYPFGFGLSYTTFKYGNLKLEKQEISLAELEAGEAVEISVDILNSGAVDGAEVVQLYVTDLEASVSRRVKELKGFEKVRLARGESKKVTFMLSKAELGIWNNHMKFVVEPGNVKIMVGASSVSGLETVLKIVK